MKKIFLFILLLSANLFAQDIAVNATLDKQTAAVGENLVYSITVQGMSNIAAPQAPVVDGLNIYFAGTRNNISIVNGSASSSVTFQYMTTANKLGEFKIPAFQFRIKDQDYLVNAVDLKITQDAPIAQIKQVAGSSAPLVFAENIVGKTEAFQNEPIFLTFKLFRRVNLRGQPAYAPAETTGFWRLDFDGQEEFTENRHDQKYFVIAKKTALYPVSEGVKTIAPAKIQVAIEDKSTSDDFWGSGFFANIKRVDLETKAIKIKVKPLPSGAPSSFNGSVAKNLSMEIRLNPASNFKQGEPVNIEVKLKGEGNIKAISQPVLENILNLKQYDTVQEDEIKIGNNGYFGSKTFKFIVVPQISGKVKLPNIRFAYFDYEQKKYISFDREVGIINVEKNDQIIQQNTVAKAADLKVLGNDIRFIKDAKKLHYSKNYFKLFLILFPLVYLFFILLKLFNHYILHKKDDINRLQSLRIAFKNLETAHVFDVLEDYFRLKFAIKEKSISLTQVKPLVPEKLLKDIENVWLEMEYFRFSSHKLSAEEMRELKQKLKNKLKEWDKIL